MSDLQGELILRPKISCEEQQGIVREIMQEPQRGHESTVEALSRQKATLLGERAQEKKSSLEEAIPANKEETF